MTTVLKLGGSVVTDKSTPETVDDDSLDAAVAAVADSDPSRLVIVHGGGSFGHHNAEKHGVSDSQGTHDAEAVFEIHDAMRRLNDAVVTRLQDAGIAALPVQPLSLGARDAEAAFSLPLDSTATMLDEGFVPVLHGDVIAHAASGATVVSGDELVTTLARGLDADRVGLCSTVPGVLDADNEVIPEITAFEDVASVLGGSDATDVTGGMAAKVRALLELGAPAHVFGPDALPRFLAGEDAGTVIRD
ncbi:isopentenyl phosphate kinase [Halogeometricum borinquense DSM 11551]|uniref:Isopentenyl phosphate kinase n=1 Tax=Halogeometricum borinquense (strain ATCC 700274 / DSM 11551 / JCM 10706 / KCTC 4070 / PR3) TaxID=469382 RepID=E4NR83_HALBP|nr:isopentenyl phosphate kinase [Halogeometricum borinquense]ADQ66819.1 isopentenyl phosphate kinase [Halogeometricum borinquense DSM 11551]ELY30327.1 isopentenyl phosphate kinase [Halogeometricum borinquense DSM 11551]